MSDVIDIINLYKKDKKLSAIFRNCPLQILGKIVVKHYANGEYVLQKKELDAKVLLVAEGSVEHYAVSNYGKKYQIRTYKKGDFVQAFELNDCNLRTSCLEGRGRLTILEIPEPVFAKWLMEDKNVNAYYMEYLKESYATSMERLAEGALCTIKQRVCQYLLDNIDESGRLQKKINIERLSESMGVTSRSVQRIIREMKDKEILKSISDNNIVLDQEKLLDEMTQ